MVYCMAPILRRNEKNMKIPVYGMRHEFATHAHRMRCKSVKAEDVAALCQTQWSSDNNAVSKIPHL